MMERFAPALLGLLLVLASASSAQAESHAGLGPHLGLNFEGDDPVFIGLGARVDIAHVSDNVELQIDPSLAYYFVDNATVMHFAVSFPFEFKIENSVVRPFTGAGLSLFYVHANNDGDLRPRLNILGGLLFALETVKPFFELRLILGHGSGFELLGGVFFNL
jgi:hypothetical protein